MPVPRRSRVVSNSATRLILAGVVVAATALVWPTQAVAAKFSVTLTSAVAVSEQSATINYAVNRKPGQVKTQECSLTRGTTVVATTCGTRQGSSTSPTRYRTLFTGLANGQYVYKVKVTLSDGGTGTLTTPAFTINFTPPNQPPVAVNDSYTTDYQTLLNVPAPGIFANDSDPDGDTLTAFTVTQPDHGSMFVDIDTGALDYVPAEGFFGTDTAHYRLIDSRGGFSNFVTIEITVTATPEQACGATGGVFSDGVPTVRCAWTVLPSRTEADEVLKQVRDTCGQLGLTTQSGSTGTDGTVTGAYVVCFKPEAIQFMHSCQDTLGGRHQLPGPTIDCSWVRPGVAPDNTSAVLDPICTAMGGAGILERGLTTQTGVVFDNYTCGPPA